MVATKTGQTGIWRIISTGRIKIRDLLKMMLEDYDVRGVAQAYIATLKVKSILNPKLGDIKAAKLTTNQISFTSGIA